MHPPQRHVGKIRKQRIRHVNRRVAASLARVHHFRLRLLAAVRDDDGLAAQRVVVRIRRVLHE